MKRFACLAITFALAACGDNNSGDSIDAASDIDAPAIDAPVIDAPPPPIDAPAVTYGGTITVLEAQLLNPGNSGTYFGQGIQVAAAFTASTDNQTPSLEDGADALGCKVWVYDEPMELANAAAAAVGRDEGAITIESPMGTQLFPTCVFTAGVGYSCPETTTQSTGGTIAGITAGPLTGYPSLTDLDTTFTALNSTNRYVRISGATNAANNGVFPILAVAGANTIAYGNPAFVAETIPATGGHINLAGVGPTPTVPDPGFLADAATMSISKAAGTDIGAFTHMTAAGSSVGDDFDLEAADLQRLNALPMDGSAFSFACAAGSCGANSGSGVIVSITTTDAPTAGLSPFAMPAPVAKRVSLRCSQLATTSLTIPAEYSAFLMNSGATRIQTTVIRPQLMNLSPVTSLSGHAIIGFTNIAN